MPARLSSSLVTLNDSHINLRVGYPEWEPSRHGTLHTVTFKASFDPVKEQHYKPTYMVVDDRARAANPSGQRLDIEMYSEWPSMFTWSSGQRVQTLLSESELFLLFGDTLGIFGQPYQIIRVPCTMVHAETNVGASVALTCAHVPDWTNGTRGVQDLPCLVIGRKREWDRGIVWLTLQAAGPAKVAYAPAMKVNAVSGSGASRVLLVANGLLNVYMSSLVSINIDDDATTYFTAGDRVTLWVWNTGTPNPQPATVTASTATTVSVTFDAGPTLPTGSESWMLSYADSSDATGISDNQKLYAYIADATKRLDVDGAVIDARVYS
jgi:hypothetical protein